MNEEWIGENEVLDDLGRGGFKILRAKDAYAYTADSVLLAHFAAVKAGDRVCDLGAGAGILPLLLCGRCPNITCDGIEKNREDVERAQRSVAYNRLEESIRMFHATFEEARTLLPMGQYSLVVSNPPYFSAKKASEKAAPDGTLDELLSAAAYLLKNRGRLALCYPAARLAMLLEKLRAHHLEPKKLRLVHVKPSKDAYLALIMCMKNAHSGLIVQPPLFLRDDKGNETEEIVQIYNDP